MTCGAFAHQHPGGWGHRSARHGSRGGWAFAKGRLSLEDLEGGFAAIREMRGGPPFGGPGFGGPRGRGWGRARARRGDVRLALLRLLGEEPRNGYQLMQVIEERSDGLWRPSPGSVYPTLSQLEDEGLVLAREGESGKLFEITDAGREHLAGRAEEPDPWAPPADKGGQSMAELGSQVGQIGRAVGQVIHVGDAGQIAKASELLAETRKALYRILAEDEEA